METKWSSTLANGAEPVRKVQSPPASGGWSRDSSRHSSSSNAPELDDDADMTVAYKQETQSPPPQPQSQPHSTCQFVHAQCEKELFTTEYLRSNKASGHKNLRCFPHCCGGHNPKSFCGSGLVVKSHLSACDVVLGRFEEVAKAVSNSTNVSTSDDAVSSSIDVGRSYDERALLADVKVSDQPFGKWFRGTTIAPVAVVNAAGPTTTTDDSSSTWYLINGNRQSWHYGWQSSRLNCKNLHVFRVYFFTRPMTHSNTRQLTCVAALASPPFRISSSRKARKTFRSPVLHPLVAPLDALTTTATTARVPSIDELLQPNAATPPTSSNNGNAKGRVGRARASSERFFPSTQRRSLVVEPLAAPLADEARRAFSRSHNNSANGYAPSLQRHSITSVHAAAAAAAAAAAVVADTAHARRERKRLTRSASLKSDYFATASFPQPQPPPTLQQQLQQQQQQQFALSATHPAPQFVYAPHQQQQHRATPTLTLPSVAYMQHSNSSSNSNNGPRLLTARRSSLAALPMPSLLSQLHTAAAAAPAPAASTYHSVTTPIMDMMQLRLESPHPSDTAAASSSLSFRHSHEHHPQQQQQQMLFQQQQRLALASFGSMHHRPHPQHPSLGQSAAAAWSTSLPFVRPPALAPANVPTIPASSPEGYLNRKRNRSTDSDKGLLAAIQASEALLLAAARSDDDGLAAVERQQHDDTDADANDDPSLSSMTRIDETDGVDLHRRARVLQLAFTIVKRVHRFDEVSKAAATTTTTAAAQPPPRVYRHSFEMLVPSAATSTPTLVQIPLSNHQLLHLCSSLVSVATSLLRAGVLLDVRQRLAEYAQAGVDCYAAYAQLVDFIDDAVHELVCQLPKPKPQRVASGDNATATEQWDLYDLLKNAEAWLLQEPWWCATDDDDDNATRAAAVDSSKHSDATAAHAALPFYAHFSDFYAAIQAALPSPRDLEVAASLRDAALNGVRGLTGAWVRHRSTSDRTNSSSSSSVLRTPKAAAAAAASASIACGSHAWLARELYSHVTHVLHVTETATTMTLALPNSLVASDAVFLFDLDTSGDPTVVLPHESFPFRWSRKRLLVAYRAWRVRGIGDDNGSAVAVQFMRWPERNHALRRRRADREGDSEHSDSDGSSDEGDDDSNNGNSDSDSDGEPEHEPLSSRRHRRRSRHTTLPHLRTRVTIYFSVFSHNRLQVRTIVEGSIAASTSMALSPQAAAAAASTKPLRRSRYDRNSNPTAADMLQYFKSPSSWELMSQVTHEYERKTMHRMHE